MIDIRLIAEEDGDELLKWRNDPVTREMSLNAGMVSTRDHCTWLKSKLESSDCSLFLGVEGDNKIGVCRFDIDECGECAEVSVTMNPISGERVKPNIYWQQL